MTTENWAVRQKIEIPFRYAAGSALTRFFEGLREKMIYASRCPRCDRRTVPPLSFCGRCWEPIEEMVCVGPRGTLESFAVVPHTVEELAEAAPVVTYGLIRLEGADTNLAHVLRMEPPAVLRVGAPVEAVWKGQRTGSILDIEHFRLLA